MLLRNNEDRESSKSKKERVENERSVGELEFELENESLRRQNVALEGENESLRRQNVSLEGENESLRRQNVSLEGENESLRWQNFALKAKYNQVG